MKNHSQEKHTNPTSFIARLGQDRTPEMGARFARNVVIKALTFFVVINFAFAVLSPMSWIGSLSIYNRIFPGRLRLPYSDEPDKAYSLSLYNLDAMFASHEIADGSKPDKEFRVIMVGDFSIWGYLLSTEDTLTEKLNNKQVKLSDGRDIIFTNLGYPVMSVTKDLLILERSLNYDPDMIIWLVTLESLPYDKQLFPPLLQNNPAEVKRLITRYHLNLNPNDPNLLVRDYWDKTMIGQRRELADIFRLQLYAPMWAATGIDQHIPETYDMRQEDLSVEVEFHGLQPPELNSSDLALDILQTGIQIAQPIPVLVVNEPIFISQGENSEVRYNFSTLAGRMMIIEQ